MSTLSSLFPDSRYNITSPGGGTFTQLYVYNTNVNSVTNGGQCCLWTVPAGVVWAKFEVWGGGGSGGGSCCCQDMARGGGAGAYARKTIRVVPGQTYTICAGSSGCCNTACCGQCGFPSYACNASATYPLCLCAAGGPGGISQCFWGTNGCCSCPTCWACSGSYCGQDFGLCAVSGSAHEGSGCYFDAWGYVPQAPYLGGGVRVSRTYCGEFYMGCDGVGASTFPGGGGGGAHAHGGPCCWGGWGAGGLVLITYR